MTWIAGRYWSGARRLHLKPKEFELLVFLARNLAWLCPGTCSWSESGAGTMAEGRRTVDVHVRWLREKIEDDPGNPHAHCHRPRRRLFLRGIEPCFVACVGASRLPYVVLIFVASLGLTIYISDQVRQVRLADLEAQLLARRPVANRQHRSPTSGRDENPETLDEAAQGWARAGWRHG